MAEAVADGEREPLAVGRRRHARRLLSPPERASDERRELSYAEAIREALAIALESDERVFLMGEDIGVYGGAFQVTGDLVERFGDERVMDTPISELGGAGVAVGAALTGMRPVYEFQFSDFSMLAMEQIVNQAAKLRYMLGGAVNVPVVFRMPTGSGLGGAAQHSQSIEAWYAHVPGLKVVEPSTPEDVEGHAARRDQGPRSGDRVRAQAALQDEGRGARRAITRRRSTRRSRAARRPRPHHRRDRDHGPSARSRRRTFWPRTGSTPK